MNKEVFDKISKCSSVDEVLELAKSNGKEITRKQAERAYEITHNEGELIDEELDNVAGGACGGDRNGYEKIYWQTEAEVQYIANAGETVQVFQGADSAYTLSVQVDHGYVEKDDNGYFDKYALYSNGRPYQCYDRTWIQK